jgi:hypothetical protein
VLLPREARRTGSQAIARRAACGQKTRPPRCSFGSRPGRLFYIMDSSSNSKFLADTTLCSPSCPGTRRQCCLVPAWRVLMDAVFPAGASGPSSSQWMEFPGDGISFLQRSASQSLGRIFAESWLVGGCGPPETTVWAASHCRGVTHRQAGVPLCSVLLIRGGGARSFLPGGPYSTSPGISSPSRGSSMPTPGSSSPSPASSPPFCDPLGLPSASPFGKPLTTAFGRSAGGDAGSVSGGFLPRHGCVGGHTAPWKSARHQDGRPTSHHQVLPYGSSQTGSGKGEQAILGKGMVC